MTRPDINDLDDTLKGYLRQHDVHLAVWKIAERNKARAVSGAEGGTPLAEIERAIAALGR